MYLPLRKNRPLAVLLHKITLLNLFSFQGSFRSQTFCHNLNKWRSTSKNYLRSTYFTHFNHFYKTFCSIKQLNSKKRRPLTTFGVTEGRRRPFVAYTPQGDTVWVISNEVKHLLRFIFPGRVGGGLCPPLLMEIPRKVSSGRHWKSHVERSETSPPFPFWVEFEEGPFTSSIERRRPFVASLLRVTERAGTEYFLCHSDKRTFFFVSFRTKWGISAVESKGLKDPLRTTPI